MQVVKNIIPAIASTNAIIAAQCIQEALKWTTYMAPVLDNYFQYNGESSLGIYSRSFKYQKQFNCPNCSTPQLLIVSKNDHLSNIIDIITKNEHIHQHINMIESDNKIIYSKITTNPQQLLKPITSFIKLDDDNKQRDIWHVQDANNETIRFHITIQ